MEWFHIKAVQFFLDGTCEGAAAAALNFATAVASEVDESQFLAAADNNTPHHSGRKRFPHSKGRLIDADWNTEWRSLFSEIAKTPLGTKPQNWRAWAAR